MFKIIVSVLSLPMIVALVVLSLCAYVALLVFSWCAMTLLDSWVE